jgi:hypothetical protein
VVDVFRQGAKLGQPIILFKTSNSDPALDFTNSLQGTTADFLAAGLVSPAVALHYGCIAGVNFPTCVAGVNDPAFELEYAPFGVDSGLCVGVASTAVANEGVTLQSCGVSARTVWIWDIRKNADDSAALAQGYFPLINGRPPTSRTRSLLTYPNNGFPTDAAAQIRVNNLTGFSNSVTDHQLP